MKRQKDARKIKKMNNRTPTFFALVQQNNSRLRTDRRHLSSLLPPPAPTPAVAAAGVVAVGSDGGGSGAGVS